MAKSQKENMGFKSTPVKIKGKKLPKTPKGGRGFGKFIGANKKAPKTPETQSVNSKFKI